jgi:hypothetical protein
LTDVLSGKVLAFLLIVVPGLSFFSLPFKFSKPAEKISASHFLFSVKILLRGQTNFINVELLPSTRTVIIFTGVLLNLL